MKIPIDIIFLNEKRLSDFDYLKDRLPFDITQIGGAIGGAAGMLIGGPAGGMIGYAAGAVGGGAIGAGAGAFDSRNDNKDFIAMEDERIGKELMDAEEKRYKNYYDITDSERMEAEIKLMRKQQGYFT